MKALQTLLIITLCLILGGCDSQNEQQADNTPEYLINGGYEFTLTVGDILTFDCTLLSIEDEFVASISNNYVVAEHIGETEIVMAGKNGNVVNKIIVEGTQQAISIPLLMPYPNPLPIETSYLFSKWGEKSLLQSSGTFHKGSYFCQYEKGDALYSYWSEKYNEDLMYYITIDLPVDNEFLVDCSIFLKEHFEYAGQSDDSDIYYHKKGNFTDMMVKFTHRKGSGLNANSYRIEFSLP